MNVTNLLPPQRFPAWTHHVLLLKAPFSCGVNLGGTSSTVLACPDSTSSTVLTPPGSTATAESSVTPGETARDSITRTSGSSGSGCTCIAECTSSRGERTSTCSTGSTYCSTSSTAAVSLAVGLSNSSVHLVPVPNNDCPVDSQADEAMVRANSFIAPSCLLSPFYSPCQALSLSLPPLPLPSPPLSFTFSVSGCVSSCMSTCVGV